MSRGTPDTAAAFRLQIRGFHPLRPAFPKPFFWLPCSLMQSITPERTRSGLGSFHSARRYSGNRFFFLFLRVLRCFSSPGSPPYAMYSHMDGQGFPGRVAPFRYLRLNGCVPLPAAFRSLPRLSSALSAKASALCPYQLDLLYIWHGIALPSICMLLFQQLSFLRLVLIIALVIIFGCLAYIYLYI